MKIAISKASGSEKYALYGAWLKAANEDVEVVDLTGVKADDAVVALSTATGLVLTGGPDIEPGRYGKSEQASLCMGIDVERDEQEFALAKSAIEMNIPVLAICRGAQLLNVAYGGTLFADIPTQFQPVSADDQQTSIEHRRLGENDSRHDLDVEPGSLIVRICRVTQGTINSAHHQGVERLGNLFAPSAYAPDGMIEAFEWGDAALGGKPFLLAVQWHPERLEWENPLSLPIAKHFLHEVAAYRALFT